MWHMMVLSSLFICVLTTVGVAVSYKPDLPAGATIVCLSGLLYVGVAVGKAIVNRIRSSRSLPSESAIEVNAKDPQDGA